LASGASAGEGGNAGEGGESAMGGSAGAGEQAGASGAGAAVTLPEDAFLSASTGHAVPHFLADGTAGDSYTLTLDQP
jgi:hypothetical protein